MGGGQVRALWCGHLLAAGTDGGGRAEMNGQGDETGADLRGGTVSVNLFAVCIVPPAAFRVRRRVLGYCQGLTG